MILKKAFLYVFLNSYFAFTRGVTGQKACIPIVYGINELRKAYYEENKKNNTVYIIINIKQFVFFFYNVSLVYIVNILQLP